MVLDTDAFNEIDDQFAIAYLTGTGDRAEVEAIYAAPYEGRTAVSAAEGMTKSFEEISRVLELCESNVPSFRGSQRFLATADDSVRCPAVADLVERAMGATHSDRLTVVSIGALTNVASALNAAPDIAERCTVVWLGGHSPSWPHNEEFNLQGDIAAAQAVFDSPVPLYVVPCLGVASHLRISRVELEQHLDAAVPIARFLTERFHGAVPRDGVRTKVIWDIAAVAWLVLPESVQSYQRATPRIAADGGYVNDPRRPQCRFAYHLDRDAIFADMFACICPDE